MPRGQLPGLKAGVSAAPAPDGLYENYKLFGIDVVKEPSVIMVFYGMVVAYLVAQVAGDLDSGKEVAEAARIQSSHLI